MERVVDPRSSRTTASAWRNPARRYFEPDHGGKSGVHYGACGSALYVPLWLHGPQVLRKGSRLPGQSDARKRHAGCVPSLDAFLSDNTKLEGSFLFFLSQACRNLPKYIRKSLVVSGRGHARIMSTPQRIRCTAHQASDGNGFGASSGIPAN